MPILLIAGLGCLLAALLLPGSANADAHHDVEVSVAGGSFTSYSSRPLLDVSALGPGDSTAAVMGVRSTMRSAGVLYLRMHGVHDDDNGCARPERTVDTTCGRGEGDLGQQLRFTVATAAHEHGNYTARWSGTAAGLIGTVDTHLSVASNATRWVRMTAALPASAGRRVESDTFRFGLGVIVRGKAGTGGAGVGGKHTHRPGSSGGGIAAGEHRRRHDVARRGGRAARRPRRPGARDARGGATGRGPSDQTRASTAVSELTVSPSHRVCFS